MKINQKLFLCKRCNKTAMGYKKFHICQDCYSEIYSKYVRKKQIISTNEMNYIEEQEQLADFYMEELNELHKRKISEQYPD